jgi:hypothetical protein
MDNVGIRGTGASYLVRNREVPLSSVVGAVNKLLERDVGVSQSPDYTSRRPGEGPWPKIAVRTYLVLQLCFGGSIQKVNPEKGSVANRGRPNLCILVVILV